MTESSPREAAHIKPEILERADIDPSTVTEAENKWIEEALTLSKEQIIAMALHFRRIARLPECGEIAKQDLYDAFLWTLLKDLPRVGEISKQELRDRLAKKTKEYPLISAILNAEKVSK